MDRIAASHIGTTHCAKPIMAGIAYWALIFVLGFALGTVRALWGAAALGEGTFILIEVPIMLGASWLAARWLTRRFCIASAGAAIAMGAFAFAVLMLAELALTASLGESPSAWLASLVIPPHLYGFLGQIAFGFIPLLAAPQKARAP